MNYHKIFADICLEIHQKEDKGVVASYIPELKKVDKDKFGVYMSMINGEHSAYGDWEEKFSIQSISKVLTLVLAYKSEGEKLWKRVGVEPPGTPFNSLVLLEHENGIPRNPLINAGALVICDILLDTCSNPKEEFLDFVRELAGNDSLEYNQAVAESEKATSFRNAAAANLIKSFGNLKNKVDDVLDLYAYTCSIDMTCADLAHSFQFLATDGYDKKSKRQIISVSRSKRLNALMQLCGFYDQAGEFSVKIGLPGKSGVGGGIVAVLPDHYAIAVWSPGLNEKGNSYLGMEFLELFTTKTEYSIF
jgi:glutaminase